MGRCDRVACGSLYRLGYCIVSNRKVIDRIASACIQISSVYCLAVSVRVCDREADVILYVCKCLISVYCLCKLQASCLLAVGICKAYIYCSAIGYCCCRCLAIRCCSTSYLMGRCDRVACGSLYRLGYCIVSNRKVIDRIASACIQISSVYCLAVSVRVCDREADVILYVCKCLISVYCLCKFQVSDFFCIGIRIGNACGCVILYFCSAYSLVFCIYGCICVTANSCCTCQCIFFFDSINGFFYSSTNRFFYVILSDCHICEALARCLCCSIVSKFCSLNSCK